MASRCGSDRMGERLFCPRSSRPVVVFGDSGISREGGIYSCDFFTEPKAAVMQIEGLTE